MVGQRRSKRGTSLRKFRAGAAGRFSADLDFSAPDDDVTVEVMAMLADAHVDGFGFRIGQLNDLTPDEMRWATCNPGHQRELVAAIEALAPNVQDREASLEVAGLQSGVSMKRMNREEFFAKLAACDEERLKKVLWNLYWRGSAAMRERIEAEVDPQQRDRRSRIAKEPPDPNVVLDEVREFVALARSGAYLGGDRRVSPSERTRWRFTFQRLVTEAHGALQAEDVGTASTAVEELVDLACATREYDYFRSEDPVEAARFVVSDSVALLWGKLRDQYGFAGFAERAAPQLIRWESRYGWTRSGWDRVSQQETSLATVLARMLSVTDMWIGFCDCYLDALDQVARHNAAKPTRGSRPSGREFEDRAANLAEWHLLLIDRLIDSEAEDRIGRLTGHLALGGPELTFLQAQLAHRRGDVSSARALVHKSLQRLPGHGDFLEFAVAIGAALPPLAQQARDRQFGGLHQS